jgi:diguanylate cyclase (GGDEF)-like protein
LGDSPDGDGMKRTAAKSARKAIALRRRPAKLVRSQNAKRTEGEKPKKAKAPSRALVVRLAAEVDKLEAQLKASRAHISDLETRIDIDPLTEILNRRGFERELNRALAYVKRYGSSAALVFVDLDEFKPVNDRHGHAAGDAVLKTVAATLVGQLRASDVVARLGGDEFAALLWHVGGPMAAAKARALERAVDASPVRWGHFALIVGASAGMALLGAHDTAAEVLARADAAMYARKTERKTAACLGDNVGRELIFDEGNTVA